MLSKKARCVYVRKRRGRCHTIIVQCDDASPKVITRIKYLFVRALLCRTSVTFFRRPSNVSEQSHQAKEVGCRSTGQCRGKRHSQDKFNGFMSICLFVYYFYFCIILPIYISSLTFSLFFFKKVTETFGTVTAVFKATWLGTQMLTEKDLPLHVAQSTLHIQCTFLVFYYIFLISLSLPLFF